MYLIQEIESMKTITYNSSSTPIYGNLGWHTPTLMFLLALLSSNLGSQHCFSGQKLSNRGSIPAQSEYHWKLVPIVGQYLLQRRKRRHDTGHPEEYHYNSLEMTSMAWLSRFYWISWCYIVRDRNVYIENMPSGSRQNVQATSNEPRREVRTNLRLHWQPWTNIKIKLTIEMEMLNVREGLSMFRMIHYHDQAKC